MALRKEVPVVGFQRFENENIPDFETALEGSLGVLEEQGIQGVNTEPPVFILLSNKAEGTDGGRLIDAVVFIGASKDDIINDLKNRL